MPYCIHHSDTLTLTECKYTENYPNSKMEKIVQKTEYHTETSTKTNIQTFY